MGIYGARAPEKNKEENEKCDKVVKEHLNRLNAHLQMNTFLADERMTLADLAVASALKLSIQTGYISHTEYKYLTRWFKTVAFQAEFIQAQGGNPLKNFPASKMNFDGKKFAEIQKDLKSGNFNKKEQKSEPVNPPAKKNKKDETAEDNSSMDAKKLEKKKKKEAEKAAKLAKLKAKKKAQAQ